MRICDKVQKSKLQYPYKYRCSLKLNNQCLRSDKLNSKTKMKFLLAIFAILGVAAATPVGRSLQDDFKEFLALIPVEELKEITCSYKDDPEVQLAVQYLRSEEFAGLTAAIREKETWVEFKNYLNDAGVDIEKVIGFIHQLITNGVCDTYASTNRGGLKDLLNELKNALPIDKIKALFYDKLANSADFQEFFAKVSSDKSRQLVEEVIALEEFQRVAAKLEALGFDLKKIKDFIYNLLGWN